MSQAGGPAAPLAEVWRRFVAGYEERIAWYVGEIESSWKELDAALTGLEGSLPEQTAPSAAASLGSMRALHAEGTKRLLEGFVDARPQGRPQWRGVTAIGAFKAEVEDLIRRLPAQVVVSGPELLAAAGRRGSPGLGNSLNRWRRRPKPLALRRLVADHFQSELLRRAPLDGACQVLFSRVSLHLAAPWQAWQQKLFQHLESPEEPPGDLTRFRRRWVRRNLGYREQAGRLLARYRRWAQQAPVYLTDDLLARLRPVAAGDSERRAAGWQRYFSYWSRQQRSVQAILDLDFRFAALVRGLTEEAGSAADSLEEEHRALVAELSAVKSALESAQEGLPPVLPPPSVALLSAAARAERFAKGAAALIRREIPAIVETITPRRALPGWHEPWRRIEPAAILARAVMGTARRLSLEGFQEAELAHGVMARELERVREVVAFGAEALGEGGEEAVALARESLVNARGLLRSQLENVAGVRGPVEAGLVRGTAAALLGAQVAIARGRAGALARLARETGEIGGRRARSLAAEGALRSTGWFYRMGRGGQERLLFALGLKSPPAAMQPAVSRIQRLDTALELAAVRTDLPLIYRRLFRLEPVSDPRFLVGRDDELAGLTDCRNDWLGGKAMAVLIVGARGSGKTSLLNCAVPSAFHDLEVLRGAFSERITEPEAMRRFLCEHLRVPPGGVLAAPLREGRRVVVLEELERTYLRTVNGFDALRYLLELITATWHNTLWVLAINERAARLLDLAVELYKYFPCRINAMAVTPDEMRSAILLRHNLSGLRLAFAPPPETDPRVSRIKRLLGLDRDPQDLFFESLYKQSEGVFRSAIQFWLHQIDTIEGGTVQMRNPLKPDFAPVLGALSLDDCYTLQAILQHGALTVNMLGRVFGETEKMARTRVERLRVLEVLETDPFAPGFRIRPEAGRFVREALDARNLG